MFCSVKPVAPNSKRLGNTERLDKFIVPMIYFYSKVVSSGHFHAFHFVYLPLEYVPTIPPHSTYVMVELKRSQKILWFSKIPPAWTHGGIWVEIIPLFLCRSWHQDSIKKFVDWVTFKNDLIIIYCYSHNDLVEMALSTERARARVV